MSNIRQETNVVGQKLSDKVGKVGYASSTSGYSSDETIFESRKNNSNKRKREELDDGLEKRSKLPRSDIIQYQKNNVKQDKVALSMMRKMGYSEGKGLGKQGQGIVEPIVASTQNGRRGLGWELDDIKRVSREFRPEDEVVEVEENIICLKNKHSQMISLDDLSFWESERKVGPRSKTIDGETIFCDEKIVKGIIDSKTMFDRLDKNEMNNARTRSNPFETIGKSIFLNRAAVKMANIDRACNFMFTEAEKYLKDDLLYFADVCAGPGGFSEYVLWRKNWRAKGFGFTLKASNDFKLENFIAGAPNTFHPYYGPEGDGDIYNPKNQKAFRDLIMSQTDNKGVHFMMADGGFSVEGKENIQEILSKQLYLCQCLVALMTVRTGGHFVTKLFDLFTPFSAGLLYIMHRCFKKVSIFKPNTSRPANSERYLICEGKRSGIHHVVDYLYGINQKLCENKSKKKDVLEIVPTKVLISDKEFYSFLKSSNENLGYKQIIGLKKIATYTENRTLIDERQENIRQKCLKYWKVPDEYRAKPRKQEPKIKAQELLQQYTNILHKMGSDQCTEFTYENLDQTVFSKSVSEFDYFCVPCSSAATIYLGMERSEVYRLDSNNGSWNKVENLQLPSNTLVYAEMVTEYKHENQAQTNTPALHIIDAFTLGKLNISDRFFPDRNRLIKLFCKALWKPDVCFSKAQTPLIRVRAKELISVNDMEHKLQLVSKSMKRRGERKAALKIKNYPYENTKDEYFYIPNDILFFKITENPWHYNFSQREKNFYFFNSETKKSQWVTEFIPQQAVSKFSKTIENRILWRWHRDNSLDLNYFLKLKHDCLYNDEKM